MYMFWKDDLFQKMKFFQNFRFKIEYIEMSSPLPSNELSSDWASWDLNPKLKSQLEKLPLDQAMYIEGDEVISLAFSYTQQVDDFEELLLSLQK